ncbi:MAG: GYF domain-containing protein [Pedobacter sp.]|nr:GYF domain-containing protein [Pedobacter sp.]
MKSYFLKGAENDHGPFTVAQIKDMNVSPSTLVQLKGEEDWLPAECHQELEQAHSPEVRMLAGMYWGPFKRDGIVRPGVRQYSSILWGIPFGQSWENACANMPATINGIYFPRPSRCKNTGSNMWGEFDVPESANALVFVNKSIPAQLGHIGWGFQLADGSYCYGSKEIAGALAILPGQPNGVFIKRGSFEAMLQDMRGGGHNGNNHPIFSYSAYKHVFIPRGNPGAAAAFAEASKGDGYALLANNCMDNAFRVMIAYGIRDDVIPNPSLNPGQWIPNNWFAAIKGQEHGL